MTCKVPIITAEYDHDPDIIHKENAMLVNDVLDFEEIAENITALASDKDFRLTVAENGHLSQNKKQYKVDDFGDDTKTLVVPKEKMASRRQFLAFPQTRELGIDDILSLSFSYKTPRINTSVHRYL